MAPRGSTKQKGTKKRGRPPKSVVLVPASQVDVENIGPDADSEDSAAEGSLDPFAELFEEAGTDDVVMLRRVSPASMIHPQTGEHVSIKGYLEDLPPGLDSYHAYVKNRYGGGVYYAQRRAGNRFLNLKSVTIAGVPKSPEITESAPGQSPGPAAAGVTVEGVPMAGTDRDFENMIRRMMVTKKLLSDTGPEQINSRLLELLINQRQDPLSLINQIGGILAAVKELFPNGANQSGTSLLDLGAQALTTVRELAQKRNAPGALAAPVRTSPALALTSGADPVDETPQNDEGQNMTHELSQKQAAALAIQQVISAFSLEPPKEPERVVTALDNVLGLDAAGRAKLAPFRGVLFDLAEMDLSEFFAANPEKRAEFAEYFESIFQSFIDPNREVLQL